MYVKISKRKFWAEWVDESWKLTAKELKGTAEGQNIFGSNNNKRVFRVDERRFCFSASNIGVVNDPLPRAPVPPVLAKELYSFGCFVNRKAIPSFLRRRMFVHHHRLRKHQLLLPQLQLPMGWVHPNSDGSYGQVQLFLHFWSFKILNCFFFEYLLTVCLWVANMFVFHRHQLLPQLKLPMGWVHPNLDGSYGQVQLFLHFWS